MATTTTTTVVSSGRELTNPPSDGISNIRFSNHSDHLLVSSWDKTVRLYDATADFLRGEFLHGGPVLDCCFHDDSSGFSASADNTVRRSVTYLLTSPFHFLTRSILSSHFSFQLLFIASFSLPVKRIFWESMMLLFVVLSTLTPQVTYSFQYNSNGYY